MKSYFTFLKLILGSRLSYRIDFVFTIISTMLWAVVLPLFFILLYSSGANFPGWTFHEILVFVGIVTIIHGFAKVLFMNFFNKVSEYVREGKLELILIKPKSEIYLLVAESFDFESITDIIIGIIIIFYSSMFIDLNINILIFILYFLLAIIMIFSLVLIASSIIIKYVKVQRMLEIIHQILSIADYPKNIYPIVIQTGFSVFIPIFVITYYPASTLLGFETEHGFLIIISTLIFSLIAFIIWKYTLRNYTGAGG